MIKSSRTLVFLIVGCAGTAILQAAPILVSPTFGTLELVTPPASAAALDKVDGLAFDVYGNLFATREITGDAGGVVFIDKSTGAVTSLVTGISRADQLALAPNGDFLVTSETTPASTSNSLWRISISYDASHRPISASKTNVTTNQVMSNVEGLVVLPATGAYGPAGSQFVAEDLASGRILQVDADGTASALVTNLQRPEGLAFGDFAGAKVAGLYAAETGAHRIIHVDSEGNAATLGTPAVVSLTSPDNVEFGPDGYLYVSEDRAGPNSRVLRIDANGTHSVFASGFSQAQGMIFDSVSGDMYIAEQDLDRVWRVVFADPLSGDYSGNGTVDAADYSVWRDTLGQAGSALAADGNHNGQVDADDYNLWKLNFSANGSRLLACFSRESFGARADHCGFTLGGNAGGWSRAAGSLPCVHPSATSSTIIVTKPIMSVMVARSTLPDRSASGINSSTTT